jgi:hypothetical protein
MSDELEDYDTREQARTIIEGDEYRGRIKAANLAIGRVMGRTEKNFADWWTIGEGFMEIRHAASVLSGTNDIQSPVYKKQFSALVGRTRLTVVDSVTRSKLLDLVTYRHDVELWWATLKPEQRLRWNHPTTVWKQWKNTSKTKKAFADVKPKGAAAELADSTPEEVAEAFGHQTPLNTVRITTDAAINVRAILKVADTLPIDARARAALLRAMSNGLGAAITGDEPQDS